MRDLHLWRALRANPLPAADDLVPLLRQAARLELRERVPFLGVLGRSLTHPEPSVRAAAVGVLGGAYGIPAWQMLVSALNDRVQSVRLAAVAALRQSAHYDPFRWVHALFHPDLAVRRRAAALGDPEGFYLSVSPPAEWLAEPASSPDDPGADTDPNLWEDLPVTWDEVDQVLNSGAMNPADLDLLENYLQQGTVEDPVQRCRCAERLMAHGRYESAFPVLLQNLPPHPELRNLLLSAPSELLTVLARAGTTLGSIDYEYVTVDALADRARYADDERALAVLLTDCIEVSNRRWARYLTGERFDIEMLIGEQDMGYTRLREKKIYISPRPILLGERGGTEVVRGLILHEYGHHLYHKGPADEEVWARADGEGLGRLLNLVSDEHLERNLRQRSSRYGDLLKTLNAYAFQHGSREVPIDNLLLHLGERAWEVLPRVPLGAARKYGHAVVSSGRLLREMEAGGVSFARFLRALRMGLGNRTGDPKVAQALALFRSHFRKSTMPELLEVARKLREIFGSETDMLNYLGPDGALRTSEEEWLQNNDGINPNAVKQAVQGMLESGDADKRKPRPAGTPAGWGLNLKAEETFNPITQVRKVPQDPHRHADYARRVAGAARRLRRYFENLGLGLKPQRFRVRGRTLDRARLRDLILKADPRLMIARQLERTTDLFLGVLIDCSGSMAGEKMEKARLFATLLAEALKGNRGVDLRLFGFEHDVIHDAGDARTCAAHALQAVGGNNDAAALWHAFLTARASRRKAKLLVMISDGLPTECSVASLRALVARLTRKGYCCAQVAVQPIEQVCFPNYILLQDQNLEKSVPQFGEVVMRLVRQALGKA